MCRLIIFGTGGSAERLEELLRKDVNIIAYADNDSSKWGKYRNERKIVSPNLIESFDYDYIAIASQYNETIYNQLLNMGLDINKIFQFNKYHTILYNPFEKRFDNYIRNIDSIETLLTGISYAETSVIETLLSKKIQKFSLASQDLFFDYKIVEHILYNYTNNKIKYIIIGLCYYSFQYDMSLSGMKYKVSLYYDILKESHNYDYLNSDFKKQYDINNAIAIKLFDKNKSITNKWVSKALSNLELDERIRVGKCQADIDCNKDYPETVKENIKIFEKYLELLKKHNIEPIVVVFPASKYYTNCFSKRIEDEFHSILNEFSQNYSFQYLDYFRSNLFTDEDFMDVSHLNKNGAEKFTNILDRDIKWE